MDSQVDRERGHAMRILVVGAGIAGLATARALERAGFRPEVVERASGPDRGGAGLYLPGNATRALRRLGIEVDGVPIRTQRILDHRGRVLTEVDLPPFWTDPCLGTTRPALHAQLAAGVPVSYGLEPTGIDAGDDRVRVELSDGSRREVDLLVGADGIRSTVGKALGVVREPRRVGQLSWRFVIELAGIDAWTVLLGRGTTFLLIPVGPGQVYCYADSDTQGALLDLFGGFAEPVPTALSQARDPYVSWIEEVEPAFGTGRVALVGDAAHATAPNMAQGVAMAVEDALVLAEELTRAEPVGTGAPGQAGGTGVPTEARGTGVAAAVAAYGDRREHRTAFVRTRSHRRDRTRGLPGPVRNAALRLAGERIYEADYRPLLADP